VTVADVRDLKPGMVIDKDIVNMRTGAILIGSGTVLNRKLILHIKNLGLKEVDIFDEKSFLKEHPEDSLVIKYEKLSDKVENTFNDIKIGKKIILTEISDEVDDLIVELISNNNILGRLKQLEKRDNYTFNHSLDVCMLATMVGKWLGYSQIQLKQLSMAGIFHDIGKLKISDDIINKPEKLTKTEFEIIKKHPIYGYDILNETVGISRNVAIGVLQHHERQDGSGYPYGLKGNEIHEFARIIAICDIYDAMTSNRVYKRKESPFLVAEHLDDESFRNLDPRITRIFLDNISKFYVGSKVKLSNGEVGDIIFVNPQMPTKPIVKVGEKYINFLEEKKLQIVDIIK
jgi:HD-GYP domain-containing protein (c-di-GMP phosphodiesterase class II)